MKKFAWADKKHSDYLEKGITRHLHKRRLGLILSEIDRIFKDAKDTLRCLDIGCGDGIYTKFLSNIKNFKCVGCDADYKRLERAKENCSGGPCLINSLAEKCHFKGGSFDLVLLHHVLEHVENDKGLLRECARVLKPDGIFIIGVPNENSVNGKILRFLQPALYRNGEHIHFYSESEMVEMLKSEGFEIVSVKRTGFLFLIYYIHMLLISNKITFGIGDFITRFLKSSADSLIIISKKVIQPAY